ncbi:MAG: tetratricopeptide repeat protein [FCB group bacterium]|nr:tetratricopeptide repeat protein [FCB group bacterium]
MEFKNKAGLEVYFADHFDTVLFPMLADIYYREGDLVRARKVCEIGLEHHPEQEDGLFVLANVAWKEGNLQEAEKHLKIVTRHGSPHLRARLMLVEVQIELGRSENTVAESYKKVLEIDPGYEPAREYVKKVEAAQKKKQAKKKAQSPSKTSADEAAAKPVSEEELDSLAISPRLATFTLVTVLKNQGLYHQALDVLKILEDKGEDKERIERERQGIQELLHMSEQ